MLLPLLLAVLYMSIVFLPLGMVKPMVVESVSVTWLREAAAYGSSDERWWSRERCIDGCGGADGEGSAQPCWMSAMSEKERMSLVSARSGDGVADKGSDGAKGETVVEAVSQVGRRDVRSCVSGNSRGSAQLKSCC